MFKKHSNLYNRAIEEKLLLNQLNFLWKMKEIYIIRKIIEF